jgi:hypothetical protein
MEAHRLKVAEKGEVIKEQQHYISLELKIYFLICGV